MSNVRIIGIEGVRLVIACDGELVGPMIRVEGESICTLAAQQHLIWELSSGTRVKVLNNEVLVTGERTGKLVPGIGFQELESGSEIAMHQGSVVQCIFPPEAVDDQTKDG